QKTAQFQKAQIQNATKIHANSRAGHGNRGPDAVSCRQKEPEAPPAQGKHNDRSRGWFVMAILVSGGAGYIGSHTCIELLNAGYDIVVADNFYNSCPVVLDRIKQITGKDFRFYEADMTKTDDVEHIFSECPDITAVIQFAAYKAVGESVHKPIEYYSNNLNCTLTILDVMRRHDCHIFVFSSSATVYGDPASVPITEDFPTGNTTNPYGTTKVFTERILTDVCKADPSMNVAVLRYFNPIGAHKSGLIGEDPNGIPNNLMPYIAKVAVGKLEKVHVFGNDYPTPDGTGVRDYIHVVDLARGHVCAIRKLETGCGLFIRSEEHTSE